MTVSDRQSPAEAPATAPGSAARRRLTTTLVVILCLAVGTLVGYRLLPFRGSTATYGTNCDGLLSTADLGFLSRSTPVGRQITTSVLEETGKGKTYRLECVVHGDGEEQLNARVRVTEADEDTWRKDLKAQGLLPGRGKHLDLAPSRYSNGHGEDLVGLSADFGAALYLPCRLSKEGTARLDVSVTAPGASDGDADDQRLAIAAVASQVAYHSLLDAGCLRPLAVPTQTPTFAP